MLVSLRKLVVVFALVMVIVAISFATSVFRAPDRHEQQLAVKQHREQQQLHRVVGTSNLLSDHDVDDETLPPPSDQEHESDHLNADSSSPSSSSSSQASLAPNIMSDAKEIPPRIALTSLSLSSSSSSSSSLLTVSNIPLFRAIVSRAVDCGNMWKGLARGLYWSTGTTNRTKTTDVTSLNATTVSSSAGAFGKCVPIPGFVKPLYPFEVSNQELSCTDDSVYGNAEYVRFGFAENTVDGNTPAFAAATAPRLTLKRLLPSSTWQRLSSEFPASLLRRYSHFAFHSSYLFRQWRRWEPLPVSTTVMTRSKNKSNNHNDNTTMTTSRYPFSAFHDEKLENLYTMNNFCVSSFSGLSGYFLPSSFGDGKNASSGNPHQEERHEPYRGKEDTRHVYHFDAHLRRFLHRVRVLPTSPTHFDERPVVFVPIETQHRWNLAHVLHRVWALLGILNKKNEIFSSDIKPLLIFVNRPSGNDASKTTAWGFFFRIFDLPWAVVSGPVPSEYVTAMRKLTGHSPHNLEGIVLSNNTSSGQSTSSSSSRGGGRDEDTMMLGDDEICFRRAVVWQNCFSCRRKKQLHAREEESYSFGDWVQLTQPRRHRIFQFREMMSRCLPRRKSRNNNNDGGDVGEASSTKNILSQQRQQQLPRMIFDIRTGSSRPAGTVTSIRAIRGLALFLEEIKEELIGAGFVSDIIVKEPWRSSRASHVDAIQSSDIFVGVHGAGMSQITLMPPKSMIVELSVPLFALHGPDTPEYYGAWFGAYSQALQHDHWFLKLWNGGPQHEFPVPPGFLVRMLKEAACRWMSIHQPKLLHHNKNLCANYSTYINTSRTVISADLLEDYAGSYFQSLVRALTGGVVVVAETDRRRRRTTTTTTHQQERDDSKIHKSVLKQSVVDRAHNLIVRLRKQQSKYHHVFYSRYAFLWKQILSFSLGGNSVYVPVDHYTSSGVVAELERDSPAFVNTSGTASPFLKRLCLFSSSDDSSLVDAASTNGDGVGDEIIYLNGSSSNDADNNNNNPADDSTTTQQFSLLRRRIAKLNASHQAMLRRAFSNHTNKNNQKAKHHHHYRHQHQQEEDEEDPTCLFVATVPGPVIKAPPTKSPRAWDSSSIFSSNMAQSGLSGSLRRLSSMRSRDRGKKLLVHGRSHLHLDNDLDAAEQQQMLSPKEKAEDEQRRKQRAAEKAKQKKRGVSMVDSSLTTTTTTTDPSSSPNNAADKSYNKKKRGAFIPGSDAKPIPRGGRAWSSGGRSAAWVPPDPALVFRDYIRGIDRKGGKMMELSEQDEAYLRSMVGYRPKNKVGDGDGASPQAQQQPERQPRYERDPDGQDKDEDDVGVDEIGAADDRSKKKRSSKASQSFPVATSGGGGVGGAEHNDVAKDLQIDELDDLFHSPMDD